MNVACTRLADGPTELSVLPVPMSEKEVPLAPEPFPEYDCLPYLPLPRLPPSLPLPLPAWVAHSRA